ncbi:DHHW family protein [Paenibacillus endoradicis]|uniref:DHHW family protein n=1 Tax=Paenibacillus endoradicis TaxID=2972487 RepID=UPI0021594093|nr:DHHW family protein [Paenibacillus endoradicis]MCR8659617.1 DHHW family protein [Paenibacillus endoradicis]
MTNKWNTKLYIIGFTVMLGGLLILFIVSPKGTFSQFENRTLQSKVSFSWEALVDKSFAEDTETYLSDQFPFRQQWFMVKSIAEQARLMTVNNGIIHGENGYLFEPLKEPIWEDVEKYVDSINKFQGGFANTHMSLLLAPTSVEMYPQFLPKWSTSFSQKLTNDTIQTFLSTDINFIDGIDALQPHIAGENNLYFRNDHHWTSYGAYFAYAEYMNSIGIEPIALDELQPNIMSSDFLGSYDTKGQFWGAQPDEIVAFTNPWFSSQMFIADDESTSDSLYYDTFLDVKDQYSYYLGGVHALMTITNEPINGQTAKKPEIDKLLVIKDSYAHNFIPLLVNHAREIHVVDLRYYNGSMKAYMEQEQFDEVLLLYNTPTFVSERSLLNLKY